MKKRVHEEEEEEEIVSSMQKRVHEEEEEEDEEEIVKRMMNRVHDEEEVNRFWGHNMFELYSATIDEFKGSHMKGKIIIEGFDFPPLVIYDGNDGENNKIGEPLLLQGIYGPLLAYEPFAIEFDLCPGELKSVREVLFPCDLPKYRVITDQIKREYWGKVTLTYQLFNGAVEACVNVIFLGMGDDGKKKYPTHVYGEIYATWEGRNETKVVLFQKSKEEAQPVDNGEPIPLLRSVIAAVLGTRLQIHVDMWGCYNSSYMQTSFSPCFEVKYNPGTDEKALYCESPVQVKVTWVEPPLCDFD